MLDIVKTQGSVFALTKEECFGVFNSGDDFLMHQRSNNNIQPSSQALKDGATISISTPISYDEETGMVQTAVRAIVTHPISSLVDNTIVGISSTLVLPTGALTEVIHCLELEWTHHATSSTKGLAILSLGHFLHYGREAIRQLVKMHDGEHGKEREKTQHLSSTKQEDSSLP